MMNSYLATMNTKSQFAQGTLSDDKSDWLKEANLDFDVIKSPLLFNANGDVVEHETKQVLVHSKTNAPLGLVGKSFEVVQPREVMSLYTEIAERSNCDMIAAGYTKQGAGMFALADTHRPFRIKGQDEINGNLLFHSSNDGSHSTTVKLTSYRMICANQLNVMGSEDGGDIIKITHASKINWDDLYNKIDHMLNNNWVEFQNNVEMLSDTKVSNEDVVKYYMSLFDVKEPNKRVERMIEVYQNGTGQSTRSAANTAWGMINAVTRFVDHESNNRSDQARLENASFGHGERLKRKAWNEVMKMAA